MTQCKEQENKRHEEETREKSRKGRSQLGVEREEM